MDLDPKQLPGVLGVPARRLTYDALAWLGACGYDYHSGPGADDELIFVRNARLPWEATPQVDALAILRAGQPAPGPAAPPAAEPAKGA